MRPRAVALVWTTPSGDTVGKFAGSCGVAAVTCALAAFLRHAHLAPGHRWVLTAALALLAIGGVLFVADVWLDAWGLTRAVGVTLIALAAFGVTVPVLHWLDRSAVAAAAATGDAIRYCPHCGRKLSGEVGVKARCAVVRSWLLCDLSARRPALRCPGATGVSAPICSLSTTVNLLPHREADQREIAILPASGEKTLAQRRGPTTRFLGLSRCHIERHALLDLDDASVSSSKTLARSS